MTERLAFQTASLPPTDRPRDEEIDLFGMTHVGLVRERNEDHFLLCTLHHTMTIHGTSLSDAARLPLQSQRLATVAMVADGVGGHQGGETASRVAIESIAEYVKETMNAF